MHPNIYFSVPYYDEPQYCAVFFLITLVSLYSHIQSCNILGTKLPNWPYAKQCKFYFLNWCVARYGVVISGPLLGMIKHL